ncbi:MAG: hypothetical protein ACRCVT_07225 [Leadbetterella sp.]
MKIIPILGICMLMVSAAFSQTKESKKKKDKERHYYDNKVIIHSDDCNDVYSRVGDIEAIVPFDTLIEKELGVLDSAGKKYKFKKYKYDTRIEKDVFADMDIDLNRMHRELQQIPRQIRTTYHRFEGNKQGVKSLHVFSNYPDAHILNVQFYTMNKGDVYVSVVDMKGSLVVKKEIKDFEGDFMSQIELPKGTTGVHFVIVSQNGEGSSRRVRIGDKGEDIDTNFND